MTRSDVHIPRESPSSQIHRFGREGLIPSQRSIVLPDPLTRTAYSEKHIESFFVTYLPSDTASSAINISSFLNVLPILCVRDASLRLALLAVGTAALGQVTGEPWMVQQGKTLYSQGLSEFGRALQDTRRKDSEALLAVPRVLGMFEILFGADMAPGVQGRSWRRHAEGELAMMLRRGPAAFSQPIAHDMFVDARMNPIISAVRTRKHCPLNEPEWKTVPWMNREKTAKDSLLDVFASVPDIMMALDPDELVSSATATDPAVWQQRVVALQKASFIEEELAEWRSQYGHLIYQPRTEDATPLSFPDLATAQMSLLYWTISSAVYTYLSKLNSTASIPNPGRFARYIWRSVPFFFAPSTGIWGAVMVAFPIGMANMYHDKVGRANSDGPYLALMYTAWANPKLPICIKQFLVSMRGPAAGS